MNTGGPPALSFVVTKEGPPLSSVCHEGLAILDNMPFHRLHELILCGTWLEGKFGIKTIDLEEIPVCLPMWRARTIISDLSETVFSLHRFKGKGNDRFPWGFSPGSS